MKNKVATTVKIESSLYDEFKILGVRHKLSLQGLIEKTIYLYVNRVAFREDINSFSLPLTDKKPDLVPLLVVSSSLS